MDEVPDCFRGEFGAEFDVEVSERGAESGVAGLGDSLDLEHVFFFCEEGTVGGGVDGDSR